MPGRKYRKELHDISEVYGFRPLERPCLDANVTSRGSRGSYQQWADMVGDQSYTFDNFLPYFKKSHIFTPPNTAKRAPNATALYNPAAFSPLGGPHHVSYANNAQAFSRCVYLGRPVYHRS